MGRARVSACVVDGVQDSVVAVNDTGVTCFGRATLLVQHVRGRRQSRRPSSRLKRTSGYLLESLRTLHVMQT